jgi:hypothetical protein
MMVDMKHPSIHGRSADGGAGVTIECGTCVAAGTTACTDCIVSHLVANDDGPIEYVPIPISEHPSRSAAVRAVDRAIELFRRAGLVDDPVEFVDPAEFEHGRALEVRA